MRLFEVAIMNKINHLDNVSTKAMEYDDQQVSSEVPFLAPA